MGKAIGPHPPDYGVCALTLDDASPSPARRVAQAVDALRHGWPIALAGAPLLLPAETGFAPTATAPQMLISAARAETLKLTNQRLAAVPHAPVLIRGGEAFDTTVARAVADPALDLNTPMKGPFQAVDLAWEEQAKAALELARIGGILPAFMVDPANGGEAVSLKASDLDDWSDTAHLAIAARARLPISAAEEAEILTYRSQNDMREHVALIIGQQSGDKVPLVRLHSECLTGDILGSLKCDCGPQLDAALGAMAREAENGGWGVLLYMRQEGRGIGLINKMRAYRLQDQGFDTVEANQRLGLPDEARDFPVAAKMLDLMGVSAVRLMTNNPKKIEALEATGVTITERVAHQLPDNPHNARYLATKRDKSGHLLI